VEARDRHYPTIYHAHRQLIHQFDGRVYQQFPVSKTTRRCIVAKKSDNPQHSHHPPGYPVDIIRHHRNEVTVAYQSRNTIVIVNRSPQQHPLFGHLPDWQNDLLRFTTIYDEHVQLLIHSDITIVTDGGAEGRKGYFGVTLAAGKIVIARTRGVARGDPRTMCSFRAEAYGFLAGISLLVRLHTIYNPPSTYKHHTIHTDSAILLSRLQKATGIVPVGFWFKTDSDVVR
jgi:hypothetical protein